MTNEINRIPGRFLRIIGFLLEGAGGKLIIIGLDLLARPGKQVSLQ